MNITSSSTASLERTTVPQVPSRERTNTAGPAPAAVNVGERQNYFNQAIQSIDSIRGFEGNLGSIRNAMADFQVRDKTSPDVHDNQTARELKNDYRKTYNHARQEQQQAQGLANNYKDKPGLHKLPNGDTVEVVQNKDGSTTVSTWKKDGGKSVAELGSDPTKFKQTDTDAKGNSTVTERDGTSVSTESNGKKTEYRLDENGRPQRSTRDFLGSTRTTVNEDGSTVTDRSAMCHPPVTSYEPPSPGIHPPPRPRPTQS